MLSPAKETRISILQVTPHIYPDTPGGLGLHVEQLSSLLAERCYVKVISGWLGSRPPAVRKDYDLLPFPTRIAPFGNPISFRMIRWLQSNAGSFDIIHAHSHLFLVSALAPFFAKIQSTPIVLTIHGLVSHSAPIAAQKAWTKMMLKSLLSLCDALICFTPADAAGLIADGANTGKIVVMPNGVDTSAFIPCERNPSGVFRIVWMGRLVRDKGLANLINALGRDAKVKDKIQITFVGTGPEASTLRKMINSLHLESVATFRGYVPNSSVPALLAEFDAMILPSVTEGLPIAALEALATGLPLLCSNLPQLVDAFGDCAVYFNPRDPEEVISAITWAIDNRLELLELGRRGRELVKSHHSLKNVGRLPEALYSRFIGDP